MEMGGVEPPSELDCCPRGQSRGEDSNLAILCYLHSVLPFGALPTERPVLEDGAGLVHRLSYQPQTTPHPQVE